MLYRHKNSALILSNAEVFEAQNLGYAGEFAAEIVFNTAMTGYQEVISDPSYRSQMVCFTYPHIGNTGINEEDWQSGQVQVSGIICNSYSPFVSNWRAQPEFDLAALCQRDKIPLLTGVDTRRLSIMLRENGSLGAVVVAREADLNETIDVQKLELEALVAKAKTHGDLSGKNLVDQVQKHKLDKKGYVPKPIHPKQLRTAVIDLGIKDEITKKLEAVGLGVCLLPSSTTADEIIAGNYDGVVISNGPGDPRDYPEIISNISQLVTHSIQSGIPIIGICLGCQLLALSRAGKILKMKFGHHGINHPVIGLFDNKVSITSQNHNYCIDNDHVPNDFVVTHQSLFDRSIQAIKHKSAPILAVQGHPEAGPGPQETSSFFVDYANVVSQYQSKK